MRKPKPESIVIVQDTREQMPLNLAQHGLIVEVDTLPYGDYTVKYPDLRDRLVIERKSLADFAACCGRERDRFENELLALRGYALAYVVGEFGFRDIMGHHYRSLINPNSLMSSIAKWSGWGIHFLFCDNHEGASYVVAKLCTFLAEYEMELACTRCALSEAALERNLSGV
ncbi:MAG TPA: ERCC4 domain-containing protein [Acidobacteriota bacterium]